MDNKTSLIYQNENEVGLLELFGEKTLDELLAAISKVTGLGIVISDYAGKPISEMVNFKPFCQKMRKSNSCQLSDASGLAQATALQRRFIYCCPCGLLEVVIPIIINHRYLGGFLAGQVRCKNIPESVPHMQVQTDLKKYRQDPSYIEAYNEIPFYDFKTFCDISELIYHIVTLLGEKSMANIQNFQVEKDKLLEQNHKLTLEMFSLRSKLDAVTQKFDPFFLYNVLIDISNMAYLEEAVETYEMINHLARYLRSVSDDEIHVKDEADCLNHYLEIFRIKNRDSFHYDIYFDKKAQSKIIPSNIIMPFLKTYIFQLVEHSLKKLSIKVEIKYKINRILIRIMIEKEMSELTYSNVHMA